MSDQPMVSIKPEGGFVIRLINEQGKQRRFQVEGVPLVVSYNDRLWQWTTGSLDEGPVFEPLDPRHLTHRDLIAEAKEDAA